MNVCLYGTYTNSHFWTDLNQTLHTSPPWSGRDRRVCVDPKSLTSSTFLVLFLWKPLQNHGHKMAAVATVFRDTLISVIPAGVRVMSPTWSCRRRSSHPRQPNIRDSSGSSTDIAEMTLQQTTESSATASYPLFRRVSTTCFVTDPTLPRHHPSNWLKLFSSQTLSHMYTPNLLKFSHYLCTCLWRWNSVPKRRHIKFRRRGITQMKTYNSSLYVCSISCYLWNYSVNLLQEFYGNENLTRCLHELGSSGEGSQDTADFFM